MFNEIRNGVMLIERTFCTWFENGYIEAQWAYTNRARAILDHAMY